MPDQHDPAFDVFVREDRSRLLGYLIKLGLSFDEAQDVASETHLRLWRNWPRDEPKAWCRATARNLSVDRHRTNLRDRTGAQWPDETLAYPAAEDLTMLKEQERAVIAHLRILPWKQREVLALHLDGFTNEEIVGLVNASCAATVASNLRHAKHQLRKSLERNGFYNADQRGGDNDGDQR